MSEIITSVDGISLKLSNLEKVLWPEDHITKAEFVQYYLAIYDKIKPFISHRPLTLIRYPDGIHTTPFYSKNAPSFTPKWIDTVQKEDINYLQITQKASLIYVANLASLELHPMSVRSNDLEKPDIMIFDLDPSEDVDFETTKKVCLQLGNMIRSLGYNPFLKTSGGKGLHIYVPIIPENSIETVVNTSKVIAQAYIDTDPQTTLKIGKEKRMGKVLIDIYRNHASQTCVSVYGTRAKLHAPISMPIEWTELNDLKSSDQFTLKAAIPKILSSNPWGHFFDSSTLLHTQNNLKTANIARPKVENTGVVSNHNKVVKMPDHKPMLATQVTVLPQNDDYIYEIKWDGIRVTIKKNDQGITLLSKSGNEFSDKFLDVIEALQALKASTAILDGELISVDDKGLPVFAQIISRMHAQSGVSRKYKVQLRLFDMTFINGVNISDLKIEDRQKQLSEIVTTNDIVKISDVFEDGNSLWEAIKSAGIEGIIAKKKGSTYYHGIRNTNWLKIKVRSTIDTIIIGYTKGKGDRTNTFGALHVAQIIDSKFKYLGKVGSGFNTENLQSIIKILSEKQIIGKPITESVENEYETVWIKDGPECEVQYASITPNGTLREPVLVKIRTQDE